MRGRLHPAKEKEKVKQLILKGKSYNEITRLLGVPKSTISTWFGKTIRKPWSRKIMLEHLASIRKLAAPALRNKWRKKREEETRLIKTKIEKELKNYPLENIGFYKSLLAMLYWTEGAKSKKACALKFANTDPKLALLYVRLLRLCYNIDETKLRIGLYVHYYHSIKRVKNFWSRVLNIPLSQFYKVYVKKRSKTKRFRKNFAGICFIYYGNNKIRKELLELGTALQKIIIANNAPVAQWIEHEVADFEVVGSNPARRTTNLYLTH